MTRFLSPEWLAEVEEAAERDERIRRAASTAAVSLRQVVRGGPHGDVAYTVRMGDGAVRFEVGAAAADLELTQDYDTAVAISRGILTPAVAFASGRLKLGGRVGLLVRHGDALAALADVFAGVRETTEY